MFLRLVLKEKHFPVEKEGLWNIVGEMDLNLKINIKKNIVNLCFIVKAFLKHCCQNIHSSQSIKKS